MHQIRHYTVNLSLQLKCSRQPRQRNPFSSKTCSRVATSIKCFRCWTSFCFFFIKKMILHGSQPCSVLVLTNHWYRRVVVSFCSGSEKQFLTKLGEVPATWNWEQWEQLENWEKNQTRLQTYNNVPSKGRQTASQIDFNTILKMAIDYSHFSHHSHRSHRSHRSHYKELVMQEF